MSAMLCSSRRIQYSAFMRSVSLQHPCVGVLQDAQTLLLLSVCFVLTVACALSACRYWPLLLTMYRGRGKSAAIGLCLAGAVAYGYSNIFVTAPSPENLGTVFEFVLKGFDLLKYTEHLDYEVSYSVFVHAYCLQYISIVQLVVVCYDEACYLCSNISRYYIVDRSIVHWMLANIVTSRQFLYICT
jgi:Helicase